MKGLSLILRVLAIAAAVASAGLFFLSKGQIAEKQAELNKALQAMEATQNELTASTQKLAELNERISRERNAQADSTRQLESVRTEMFTARQEVSRSQQQLREARQKISDLEESSRRIRSELVKTEQGLAASSREGEINQLNQRISELEKTNTTLKAQLSKANDEVASLKAAQQTVSTQIGSTARPGSGLSNMTTVNSINVTSGLIVLDSSPALGLARGQVITLTQDFKPVGKIQIQTVTKSHAVANILPGTNTRSLKAGNTVQLLR